MLKSHGTEMRGGYVRSQVVLSKEIIDSPMCESPDYFVALSLAAYSRFKDTVPDYGLIIYDPAFVDKLDQSLKCTQKEFPAKQLSVENFDNPLFSNTLVLGVIARAVGELDKDVVLESLLEVIPKFHDRNRDAFQIGYEYFS
jgi:2-oxoglutarate ferredoxin oxidoreductase subunit gamma